MFNNLYITCSKNKIEIKEKNPYIKLLLDIFCDKISIPTNNIDHLNIIFEELLFELTIQEEKIIRLKYGFDQQPMSIHAIANEFNVTDDKIFQIFNDGLKKLQHPSRYKRIMQTIYYESKLYKNTFYSDYQSNVLELIKLDVDRYTENPEFPTIYLHNIIDKNKKKDNNLQSIPLDDLYFSMRTYYCLKRAGIETSNDLFMYKDIGSIKNLTKNCIREIFSKLLDLYGKKIENFPIIQSLSDSDINLYNNLKKVIIQSDLDSIAENYCPSPDINTIYENVKSLFDIDFSPSLINILLLHGYYDYLYIIKNAEIIINELETNNYKKEADELKDKINKLTDFSVINHIDLDLFNIISKNNIIDFEGFKNSLPNVNDNIKTNIYSIVETLKTSQIDKIEKINFINNSYENEDYGLDDN